MRSEREIRVTGRELQVLELAAQGNTDKQIALNLDISKDTVASYWRRILLKFNAVSRTEVVALHAQKSVMERFHKESGDYGQLIAEFESRTLAQASELAQRNILQSITECSLEFISGRRGFRQAFERFLHEILGLTQSEYGFLAEVLYDEHGAPYLKTHALTNIAWNVETRALYEKHYFDGLEFRTLQTLFGHCLTTGETVIANSPKTDPRRGGLPPGHPTMTAFLGVPVFSGDDLVGMIGLANRPGGYDQATLEYIRPMISTCANFIMGWRAEQERKAMEQQLAESATLIRALTDAMPACVLFEDHNRRLQYVNKRFLEVFGADGEPEDFVGADCAAVAQHSRHLFAHPDEFMARVDELLAAKEAHLGELVVLADGRILERDFVPVFQGERLLGYLWKYREVTAWRNERETLSSIVDSSLDAVIVIGASGHVEFWNSRAEEIFGYSADEAQGVSLADLIIPLELRESHTLGLKRFLETGQARVLNKVIQIQGMTRSGTPVDVDLFIACIQKVPERRFSAFIRLTASS